MTDKRTPTDPGEPDTIAGELALRLLEGDELAAALRRVLAEPAFARDVERWRAHFAQLFADWPEVTPPDSVFPEIERMLDHPGSAPVRRSTGFWPLVAGVATLVAACLALVMILRPAATPIVPPPPPPAARIPVLVAQLAPPNPTTGTKPVAALYDPANGSIRVAQARFADPDRAAELWAIPGDGVPRSMGVLYQSGETPMPVGPHNRMLLKPGVTLAVSIEPLGGSPTGKPTGPVVATGVLSLV